jgi:hypothetical protein
MINTNDRSVSALNLTAQESEIIGYFVQGQKQSIVSQHLKIEYTETSIRLSDANAKLIGISKQVSQWQRKVLISNNSVYKAKIVEILTAQGFISRQKSSHPEFAEYHYYQLPDGYKLNYTQVIQLWKIWWHNKSDATSERLLPGQTLRYHQRGNITKTSIDILIFSKGNWYLVRDLQPKQGNFSILTARGEIAIEPEEYIVWLNPLTEPLQGRTESQQSVLKSAPQIADLDLANIIRPSTLTRDYLDRLPQPEEEMDLEYYLSTFNTEDSEDIDRIEGIYNIGELLGRSNILDDVTPVPTPPEVLSVPVVAANSATVEPPISVQSSASTPAANKPPQSSLERQAALKLKAIDVLATYVRAGDEIVRTEVLKNAQGQEINRKTTKIHRDCPSWAIEQIKLMSGQH